MKTLQYKLFECLETACLAEGGDGDSALVTKNYKKAADAFEKWLTEKNNKWWTRSNGENFVSFYNNQEAIWFVENKKDFPDLVSVFETEIWDL